MGGVQLTGFPGEKSLREVRRVEQIQIPNLRAILADDTEEMTFGDLERCRIPWRYFHPRYQFHPGTETIVKSSIVGRKLLHLQSPKDESHITSHITSHVTSDHCKVL